MNIKRYGDKVTLFCADILKEELPECQVDVLVSNPPYITESERTGYGGEMYSTGNLNWPCLYPIRTRCCFTGG